MYDSDQIIPYKFLFYILNLEIVKLMDPSTSCEQWTMLKEVNSTREPGPGLKYQVQITDDGVTLGHTTRVLQCLCLAGECAAGPGSPGTRGKGHIRTTFAPDTLHI